MRRFRANLGVLLLGAALAAAAVPAWADQDAVQFFRDIDVTPDAPVHDAVCFFCNVHVNGQVQGDVVVFFGGIRLNGEADHDVVNFFGDITAEDNSSIHGDMVSIFGDVRLGENVSVGKDMVSIFGRVRNTGPSAVHGNRVSIPGLVLLLPLLVIFLVLYVIVYELRVHRQRRMAQGYPYPPAH